MLKLAEGVDLAGEFTAGEQPRAHASAHKAASAGDPRLQVALENTRFGSASSVPASPQRVIREKATEPDEDGFSFRLGDAGLNARQMHAIRMLHLANPESDDRLRLLEGTQFGFTQTIPAAPQLIG